MEQQKHQFPTEEVTLPSKGLLYSKDHPLSSGLCEIKYMTAREEDILTNQNLIKNGTVIDKLLQSLLVTKFDFNDLLIGDKNAILVAARILGYGSEYNFKYKEQEVSVDLTDIKDKTFDESYIINKDNPNEFSYKLPFAKKEITFKLLTQGDDTKIANEVKGFKKLNKKTNVENTTRWKHIILSIDGDYEKKTIREFVDSQLLARDARELRNHIQLIQPDVDLKVDIDMPDGTLEEDVMLPLGVGFFWPDVEL
tara:strand:- start:7707 stop:8465 length:759 start_codon:yes stop_codon:yes gene_type:complete